MDDDTKLLLLGGAGALAFFWFKGQQKDPTDFGKSVGTGIAGTAWGALSGAALESYGAGYRAGQFFNQNLIAPISNTTLDVKREYTIASSVLKKSSGFTTAKAQMDPLGELAAALGTLGPSAQAGATSLLSKDTDAQKLLSVAAVPTALGEAGTAVWDAWRAGWNTLPLGGVWAMR